MGREVTSGGEILLKLLAKTDSLAVCARLVSSDELMISASDFCSAVVDKWYAAKYGSLGSFEEA